MKELPFVKFGAISQSEAGQEVGPVQFDRFTEEGQASRTDLAGWMVVSPAGGQQALKLGYIQP